MYINRIKFECIFFLKGAAVIKTSPTNKNCGYETKNKTEFSKQLSSEVFGLFEHFLYFSYIGSLLGKNKLSEKSPPNWNNRLIKT